MKSCELDHRLQKRPVLCDTEEVDNGVAHDRHQGDPDEQDFSLCIQMSFQCKFDCVGYAERNMEEGLRIVNTLF